MANGGRRQSDPFDKVIGQQMFRGAVPNIAAQKPVDLRLRFANTVPTVPPEGSVCLSRILMHADDIKILWETPTDDRFSTRAWSCIYVRRDAREEHRVEQVVMIQRNEAKANLPRFRVAFAPRHGITTAEPQAIEDSDLAPVQVALWMRLEEVPEHIIWTPVEQTTSGELSVAQDFMSDRRYPS